MSKRTICLALSALLFALCSSVEAQQPANVPRIGFISATPISAIQARIEAFRQGLLQVGYQQGKNIFIEYRDGEGKPDHIPVLAAELVRLKVDVIAS